MPLEAFLPATEVYVALGSNLNDPQRQVELGLEGLDRLRATRLLSCSRRYRTAPVGGPPGQPDYVNAVARLETRLSPGDLLRGLQVIEMASGRRRAERWGSRTLDLDLLLYGQETIDTPELCVPHPRLSARPFVLIPLAEVAPADLVVPGQGVLADLRARAGSEGVQPIPIPSNRVEGSRATWQN